jgi:hypothetical protein
MSRFLPCWSLLLYVGRILGEQRQADDVALRTPSEMQEMEQTPCWSLGFMQRGANRC